MDESDQSVASLPARAADSALQKAGSAAALLASLTAKQRAVLDLLIDHRTSKEISRILGISHHTVDQRIMLARAKFGVATRAEVAQAYRRLIAAHSENASIYAQPVYDFSDVAPLPVFPHDLGREDAAVWSRSLPARREALARAVLHGDEALTEPYHRVLPEMFDGSYGTIVRLGTIAILAMFLILVVMGGLALFTQLSQIIAH